jgi:endogenous inhibitor of DNA gyrase (YacG/DUF329 family)
MRCPQCHTEFEPATSASLPFCGARCKQIDLGNWLGETYRVPVVPNPEADEAPDDDWTGETAEPEDDD